jgi:hypothetical protein
MIEIHEEYLTDVEGNKKAVVVPLDEWKRILEALEELDDIRAYDEAKSKPSDPIPFDQAVDEVRRESQHSDLPKEELSSHSHQEKARFLHRTGTPGPPVPPSAVMSKATTGWIRIHPRYGFLF